MQLGENLANRRARPPIRFDHECRDAVGYFLVEELGRLYSDRRVPYEDDVVPFLLHFEYACRSS